MNEKIDNKHPRFAEFIAKHKIVYPSIVQRFLLDDNGETTPVYWNEVKSSDVRISE